MCSLMSKSSFVVVAMVPTDILQSKLSPMLALVLTHDLLLSKRGIALPAKHGLSATVLRHKNRLSAELTKLRVRKGFATTDALRVHVNEAPVNDEDGEEKYAHPRWIRINTLRTTLEEQLESTFADLVHVTSVKGVSTRSSKAIYVDEHIPNLVAVSPSINLTSSKPYREGKLIFQDKASCFPAYLLNPGSEDGDIIDATAAPGNKTTHLAAILRSQKAEGARVVACEKDAFRSKTLLKMTKLADPEGIIKVKAEQNFLKLGPNSKDYSNVTGMVLDPSCSGSGIVGRDEGGIVVHLPNADYVEPPSKHSKHSKKRKRTDKDTKEKSAPAPEPEEAEDIQEEEPDTAPKDALELATRLIALSDFQLRIVEHAMAFGSARRITYSTCSIHGEENEGVVVRAILSDAARVAGWRVMKRAEQVDGMKRWHRRGDISAVEAAFKSSGDSPDELDNAEVADACIRCDKSTEDGTMGFFVAGFVRDESAVRTARRVDPKPASKPKPDVEMNDTKDDSEDDSEEEWGGFDE
jgi:putative methyltransferase